MAINIMDYKLCLEMPEHLSVIEGAAWVEHIPFAFFVMETARPAVVVELGVWAGDSYLAWCQAAQTLQLQAKISGVDHWHGDFQTGEYGEQIYHALAAYHDPKYGHFSTLIRSPFDDAAGRFADGSIDLLHIDGLHTYKAVKRDFETWLPKMSRRGVILFHDIAVRERQFGVWKLWEEISARYPHFAFEHGYGLGVLMVGADVAAPLRQLARLSPEEALKVRTVFAQLGAHVRAVESREIVLKSLNVRMEQERASLNALEGEMRVELRRLADAPPERAAGDALLRIEAEHAVQLQRLEARIAELQAELARQAGEYGQLVKATAAQRDAFDEQEIRIRLLRSRVRDLEELLSAVFGSKRYRIGSALIWLPRTLRDAFGKRNP